MPDEMILLHYGWSHGIHSDDCLDAMIRHNFAFVREVCKVIKHKEHFVDATPKPAGLLGMHTMDIGCVLRS